MKWNPKAALRDASHYVFGTVGDERIESGKPVVLTEEGFVTAANPANEPMAHIHVTHIHLEDCRDPQGGGYRCPVCKGPVIPSHGMSRRHTCDAVVATYGEWLFVAAADGKMNFHRSLDAIAVYKEGLQTENNKLAEEMLGRPLISRQSVDEQSIEDIKRTLAEGDPFDV